MSDLDDARRQAREAVERLAEAARQLEAETKRLEDLERKGKL